MSCRGCHPAARLSSSTPRRPSRTAAPDERCPSEADRQLFGLDELRLPIELARLHVDGGELAVESSHINIAEANRNAAVVRRMRLFRDQILVELMLVPPDEIPSRAIEREQ